MNQNQTQEGPQNPANNTDGNAILDNNDQRHDKTGGGSDQNPQTYIDPEFRPTKDQLTPLKQLFKRVWQSISWRYPSELLETTTTTPPTNPAPPLQSPFNKVLNDINPSTLSQSIAPYGYFHDALKSLSTQPSLIQRLIDCSPFGADRSFRVWINQCGEWKSLKIDSFFPVVNFDQNSFKYFLGGPTSPGGCIWPMLLQKAYVKSHGGYHRILMGDMGHVLRDLTGAQVTKYKLGEARSARDRHRLWVKMRDSLEKGHLINARFEFSENFKTKKEYYTGVVKVAEIELESQPTTLPSGRGCPDVLKLVLINPSNFYNPGTKNGYLEALAEKELPPASLEALLEQNGLHSEQKCGFFWITFRNFLNSHDVLSLCKVQASNKYSSARLELGAFNINRSLAKIIIERSGKYQLTVSQHDKLSFPVQKFALSYIHLIIIELRDDNIDYLGSKFGKARNLTLSCYLKKGDYMVLIEQEIDPENLKQLQRNPKPYTKFRDLTFSSYGPEKASVIALSLSESFKYYNFLLYQNQKNIASKMMAGGLRKCKKSIKSRFVIPLKAPNSVKYSLLTYVVRKYGMTFYLMVNKNEHGFRFKLNFQEKDGEDVIGPKGAVGLCHEYSISAFDHDLFIFRRSESYQRACKGSEKTKKGDEMPGEGLGGVEAKRSTMKIWSSEVYFLEPEAKDEGGDGDVEPHWSRVARARRLFEDGSIAVAPCPENQNPNILSTEEVKIGKEGKREAPRLPRTPTGFPPRTCPVVERGGNVELQRDPKTVSRHFYQNEGGTEGTLGAGGLRPAMDSLSPQKTASNDENNPPYGTISPLLPKEQKRDFMENPRPVASTTPSKAHAKPIIRVKETLRISSDNITQSAKRRPLGQIETLNRPSEQQGSTQKLSEAYMKANCIPTTNSPFSLKNQNFEENSLHKSPESSRQDTTNIATSKKISKKTSKLIQSQLEVKTVRVEKGASGHHLVPSPNTFNIRHSFETPENTNLGYNHHLKSSAKISGFNLKGQKTGRNDDSEGSRQREGFYSEVRNPETESGMLCQPYEIEEPNYELSLNQDSRRTSNVHMKQVSGSIDSHKILTNAWGLPNRRSKQFTRNSKKSNLSALESSEAQIRVRVAAGYSTETVNAAQGVEEGGNRFLRTMDPSCAQGEFFESNSDLKGGRMERGLESSSKPAMVAIKDEETGISPRKNRGSKLSISRQQRAEMSLNDHNEVNGDQNGVIDPQNHLESTTEKIKRRTHSREFVQGFSGALHQTEPSTGRRVVQRVVRNGRGVSHNPSIPSNLASKKGGFLHQYQDSQPSGRLEQPSQPQMHAEMGKRVPFNPQEPLEDYMQRNNRKSLRTASMTPKTSKLNHTPKRMRNPLKSTFLTQKNLNYRKEQRVATQQSQSELIKSRGGASVQETKLAPKTKIQAPIQITGTSIATDVLLKNTAPSTTYQNTNSQTDHLVNVQQLPSQQSELIHPKNNNNSYLATTPISVHSGAGVGSRAEALSLSKPNQIMRFEYNPPHPGSPQSQFRRESGSVEYSDLRSIDSQSAAPYPQNSQNHRNSQNQGPGSFYGGSTSRLNQRCPSRGSTTFSTRRLSSQHPRVVNRVLCRNEVKIRQKKPLISIQPQSLNQSRRGNSVTMREQGYGQASPRRESFPIQGLHGSQMYTIPGMDLNQSLVSYQSKAGQDLTAKHSARASRRRKGQIEWTRGQNSPAKPGSIQGGPKSHMSTTSVKAGQNNRRKLIIQPQGVTNLGKGSEASSVKSDRKKGSILHQNKFRSKVRQRIGGGGSRARSGRAGMAGKKFWASHTPGSSSQAGGRGKKLRGMVGQVSGKKRFSGRKNRSPVQYRPYQNEFMRGNHHEYGTLF